MKPMLLCILEERLESYFTNVIQWASVVSAAIAAPMSTSMKQRLNWLQTYMDQY